VRRLAEQHELGAGDKVEQVVDRSDHSFQIRR